MSEKTTDAKAPARTIEAVDADIARERAKLAEQLKARDAYEATRHRAMARRERLADTWKRENPGEPFDPSIYSPPADIPPSDTPLHRECHMQHYVIGRLEKERDELKKSLVVGL